MAEKSKGQKKQNIILPICLALAFGFLLGVVVTVFKLNPTIPQGTAPQANSQQAGHVDSEQDQAIHNLEAKVTANPEDSDAWVHLGHLYYDSKQPEKAIGAYTKSLELKPGDANLYTDLGVMYRRTDQPQKAIESFDKAIAIDSIHIHSRLNKGIVMLYDLNNPEAAFVAWEEVLQIDPEAKLANGDPLKSAMEQIKKDLATQK